MSERADGNYTGTISGIEYQTDQYNEDGLVLCFDITLADGGVVRAKHQTHGEYAGICKSIVTQELGLEWPKGVAHLDDAIGKTVGVKLKTRTSSRGKTFQNAYIITAGSGGTTAKQDDINRTLRALAGGDDDDTIF